MGAKNATFYSCQKDECKNVWEEVRPCQDACDCDEDACVPSCCGQKMTFMEAKTADQTTEKHVPLVERIDGGFKVTVGSTLHPMEEAHFIEWIEVRTEDKVYRQYLKPGQKPEAIFLIEANTVTAYEHCNLHGLWIKE